MKNLKEDFFHSAARAAEAKAAPSHITKDYKIVTPDEVGINVKVTIDKSKDKFGTHFINFHDSQDPELILHVLPITEAEAVASARMLNINIGDFPF